MTLNGEHTSKAVAYACPFAGRCSCLVKFRVVTTETHVFLYTHGKHTPESHSAEHGFTLSQKDRVASLCLRKQPCSPPSVCILWPAPPMSAEALILLKRSGAMKYISHPPNGDPCSMKFPKCVVRLCLSFPADCALTERRAVLLGCVRKFTSRHLWKSTIDLVVSI